MQLLIEVRRCPVSVDQKSRGPRISWRVEGARAGAGPVRFQPQQRPAGDR